MSISNNLNSSRSQVFAYDPLNRLISAGTTATSGNYCWGYVYTYDAWGNLTAQAASSGYSGCTEYLGPGSTATGNNQLSGFAYDPSGNTLSDGVYSYTWDGESQIKTAAGVTYSYDGDGRRVSKSTGKLYWYGSGGEILAETDGSGNTQNEYIFFGGKRVAMLPAGSSPLYYVGDMLGSSRVITTSTGVVCYDADFYPYGGEAAYTNSCAQNYKFEGKERDSETQNDEFGARSYSWRFGRWLSADWSNVPVAVPYANLTNPQTLNLYAMVADDPESFADLDGHYFNTGFSQPESAQSQDLCARGVVSACNADQSTEMIREAETQAAQAQNQKSCGFLCRLGQRVKNGFKGHGFKTNEQLLPKGTVTTTETYSIHEPNPSVTAATDAAGIAGLAAGEKVARVLGPVNAGVSIYNDPSKLNIAINVLGLIRGSDAPMAITGAFIDFLDYGINNSNPGGPGKAGPDNPEYQQLTPRLPPQDGGCLAAGMDGPC
jgi:RHS repeat-associated protein